MKFLIFRTENDDANQKGELVGVEYGAGIDDVIHKIICAINDDLAARPENQNCEIHTYAPDTLGSTLLKKTVTLPGTRFEFMGVVAPLYSSQNRLHPYLVEASEY